MIEFLVFNSYKFYIIYDFQNWFQKAFKKYCLLRTIIVSFILIYIAYHYTIKVQKYIQKYTTFNAYIMNSIYTILI